MRSVVVVGAGIAGLVLAIELRLRGCAVTVVERRYPGAGNSGRNVGRIRRMQLTPDLTAYACRAADRWQELDRLAGGRNPLLYPTRYVWVLYEERERALVEPLAPMWRELGARTAVVDASAVLRAAPVLAGGEAPVAGVVGEAALVHHDAALHGCLLRARELGAEVVLAEDVVGLHRDGGVLAGVRTASGRVLRGEAVVNAAGGRAGDLARALGLEAVNVPVRREVLVTEPRRPFMDAVVTFYRPQEGWFNQTLRGELVAGVVDPDEPTGLDESSSLRFLARTARVVLAKAPRLGGLRVVRQWAGVYDTTPDKRPLVGAYPHAEGVYALNGWSGRGMLLAPLSAELLARELTGGGRDPLLAPFDPARFAGGARAAIAGDYYAGYAH